MLIDLPGEVGQRTYPSKQWVAAAALVMAMLNGGDGRLCDQGRADDKVTYAYPDTLG